MTLTKLPSYVMVSPALENDEWKKQGEIADLIIGHREEDSYFLRFADRNLAAYPAASLLMLKPADDILEYLDKHGVEMPTPEFNTLHNIFFLMRYGNDSAQKQGLNLARNSSRILEASTVLLSHALEQAETRQISRR